jgi:hypothetical protein
MALQTYKLVGGDHSIPHWDMLGFPHDTVLKMGGEVNTELDLLSMFRSKFKLVAFNGNALNIDSLFNPPKPPKCDCLCGN